MYIFIFKHMYIHIHIHVYVYAYIYIHIHVHIHIYTHPCTYLCIYTHINDTHDRFWGWTKLWNACASSRKQVCARGGKGGGCENKSGVCVYGWRACLFVQIEGGREKGGGEGGGGIPPHVLNSCY